MLLLFNRESDQLLKDGEKKKNNNHYLLNAALKHPRTQRDATAVNSWLWFNDGVDTERAELGLSLVQSHTNDAEQLLRSSLHSEEVLAVFE